MKGEFERKDTGKNFDHEYENTRITLDMNGIKITNLTDRANNSFSLIIHDLSNFRLKKPIIIWPIEKLTHPKRICTRNL